MADERDEIRRRADLVALIGQQVKLVRKGKAFMGLCPFHPDKNPSFSVSPDMGRYQCWSCGKKGDVFDWVMETQKLEFREALEYLAQLTGVELKKGQRPSEGASRKGARQSAMEDTLEFFRGHLASHAPARDYCSKRGLDAGTLSHWEVGYAPDLGEALAVHLKKKGHRLDECRELFLVDRDPSGGYFDKFRGRLIFPIRNERGDLVAFGGRLITDGQPKYINSGDTPLYSKSRVLYGLFQSKPALTNEAPAVLCEGYLDVIACHQAGVKTAVASLGTSLTEMQAQLLRRWTSKVVILYDGDAAGRKAALRALEVLKTEGFAVRVAWVPQGDDPDTVLRRDGPSAVQVAVQNALTPVAFQLKMLEADLGVANEAFWTAAIEVLATSTSELQIEKHVMELAGQYPGFRDPIAARDALQREVAARRKPAPRTRRPGAATAPKPERDKLDGAERAVLAALLRPTLRDRALTICRDRELWITEAGDRLSHAVSGAVQEFEPNEASTWALRLQEQEQDLLATLEAIHVTETVLQDAIASLHAKREQRAIRDLRSSQDRRLEEISERLRKLKAPD